MLRVNTTAGWRGAEQGRTVGIQTNTLSHSSKSVSPHRRSRRTVSYHSGQFGPPYPDSSPGKYLSWHSETNRQTKNSSAVRGGAFTAATQGTVQHGTTQSTVQTHLEKQLRRSSDETSAASLTILFLTVPLTVYHGE